MLLLFPLLLVFLVFLAVSASLAVLILKVRDKPWGFWSFIRATAVVFASLGLLINFIAFFTTPMKVDAVDIYGEYEIDRSMFPGPNADWQYETYRMEITRADELKLHQMKEGRVIATYTVPVKMLRQYSNTRLKLEPGNEPRHHMLRKSPIMIRHPWSFYYVFNSPHYGNMYFRKTDWWLF